VTTDPDAAPDRAGGPAFSDSGEARDAHEALCRRCGVCCLEKVAVKDLVLITDTPCRHLDPETRTCRVYEKRTRVNGRCLSVAEAIAVRALPADCPYVRDRADYEPPVRLSERPDLRAWIEEAEAEESGG
jgi:hypothetical protein